MKRYLALSLAFVMTACTTAPSSTTTIIYHGGTIYTADTEQSTVEVIAVEGTDIVFVGAEAEARLRYTSAAAWVDLEGKFLMPGIHDAHIHPSLALEGETCRLPAQNSLNLSGIINEVTSCIESLGERAPLPGEWITVSQFNGYGSDSPNFLGSFPDIATGLDEISTQHKIIMIGIDGHAYAVNHKALREGATFRGAAVTIDQDSLSGELRAYAELIPLNAHGLPTGQLKSQAAWDLFKYESLSVEGFLADHERFNEYFVSNGITAFTEAWAQPRDLNIYEGLARNGTLLPRVTMAFHIAKDQHVSEDGTVDIELLLNDLEDARARFRQFDRVKVDGVKVFVDGVIEYPTQTAALEHMYLNAEIDREGRVVYREVDVHHRGQLELSATELNRVVTAVDANDGVVHFHAIGDRAVSVALDAVAAARETNGGSIPHNISHLQLVAQSDIDRFGELEVFATPSPAWFMPWQEYDASVIPFISEVNDVYEIASLYNEDSDYMNRVYPIESIRRAGGVISIGSDAPVDFNGPRPLTNIVAAALRADWVNDRSDEAHWVVLNENERMTVQDAIDGYTINAARAMRIADLSGSLEVGKRADFIVINNDLIALAQSLTQDANAQTEQSLYQACDLIYDDSYCTSEVLATFIDGMQVYGEPL